jgi:hypothetical protein
MTLRALRRFFLDVLPQRFVRSPHFPCLNPTEIL